MADRSRCNADNSGCTAGDECRGGVCTPGIEVVCGTGSGACGDLTCLSTGDDTHMCEPRSSGSVCTIGTSCYARGDINPSNTCQICDPDLNPTGWTDNPGASCTLSCDRVCAPGGGCTGSPSSDLYEPPGRNESAATAAILPSITDTDDFPHETFNAVLYPSPGDEDWYRYHVDDTSFGEVQPRIDLINIDPSVNYDLCAYFECDAGRATTVGCGGSSISASSGSLPGCCSAFIGSGPEYVRLNPDCGGDESGNVYVRVSRGGGTLTCSYALAWGDAGFF